MSKSKKTIAIILSIIFSAALFFTLLFTSMQMVVYNMNYFERHYEKRNITVTTGMNMDDLMMVTEHMMDYLADKNDDLDIKATVDGTYESVFGQREILHMIDVKNLFVAATWIRNISVCLILLFVIGGIFKFKDVLKVVLSGIKFVFAGLLLAFVFLGYLFYTDFSKYFIIFHEIFFDNDLWLLDPRTDVLINMVPQDFFFATAMICIGIFLASLIGTGVIAEITRKRLK